MTTQIAISRIEHAFDTSLPADYKDYLTNRARPGLGDSYEFPLPAGTSFGRFGIVDGMHTAEEILENDANNASWDDVAKMLIVGWDLSGGFVYLSLAQERPGIFYRCPHESSEYVCVASTFTSFLAILREQPD